MNVVSFVAATGLLGLVSGAALVNAVHHPRAAQLGTIVAGIGILMLAVAAAGHLLGFGCG
jgi:hypothetical protein